MKGERADWKAIRAEYIKDERTSYRSLAKKHSVSLAALVKRAINEKWVELRKQKKNKSISKKHLHFKATCDIIHQSL